MSINTTRYSKTILLLLISSIVFFSCTYKKVELKKECDLPASVSFGQDILPVLNTQCSTPGCHTSSEHAGSLNLESNAAYTQLLSSGSGYVDTITPEYSILYNKLISASDAMPPSGRLDDCKINLILKWIQQKAKNN